MFCIVLFCVTTKLHGQVDSIKKAQYKESVILQKKGGELYQKRLFQEAIEAFQESYDIRIKYFGNNHKLAFFPLLNLANVYFSIGNTSKALDIYTKAQSVSEKVYGVNYPGGGRILNEIGIIHKTLGNPDKALSYYENALNLLRQDSAKRASLINLVKINKLYALLDKKAYYKVITLKEQYLKEASSHKVHIHNAAFQAFYALKEIDKANIEFKQILKIASQSKNKSQQLALAKNLSNYAILITTEKINEDPIKYLDLALDILFKYTEKRNSRKTMLYSSYGFCYQEKAYSLSHNIDQEIKYLEKALKYYQKAAISACENFDTEDPYIHPPIDDSYDNIHFLIAVKRKAKVFYDLADIFATKDKAKSLRYYQLAFESYEIATKMIHFLRIGYLDRESKLFLAENESVTYKRIIQAAHTLYKYTQQDIYLQKMFEYSEKSKSATFLSAVRDIEAKAFGGIPDTLINQENDLKQELSFYKEQIFNENQQQSPDTEKIGHWNSRILELDRAHSELTHYFETEYPKYYSFKYLNKVKSIPEIQRNLDSNQAVIEYVLHEEESNNDGFVYTFLIKKNEYKLIAQKIDSTFIDQIKSTKDFLINSSVRKTKQKDFNRYCNASFALYSKLIKPIQDEIQEKELILIPDSKLSYIPFEALISSPNDPSEGMNFAILDYLIKNYSFSYSYSSTLHFDYFNKNKEASEELLAFTPTYSPDIKAQKSNIRGSLFPLIGAKEEVEAISQQIPTKKFSEDLATETQFKKHAANYDILHLAMHTLVNDTIPMYSKLVFTDTHDSINDNLLNTEEIYNMHLRARMAVLSACNTGVGKLYKGEGVMSLARGFLYAGCPSIVMTLWEVDDKSSAEIMTNFYSYLKKGKTKNEALRLAKLQHLKQADSFKAHPYFWLSYVVVGDTSALYQANYFYFILILIAAIFIWIFYEYRSAKKKKRLNM